jgi:hypothetical protein
MRVSRDERGAALGPQRVGLVQDVRNPPLLGEGREGDGCGAENAQVDVRNTRRQCIPRQEAQRRLGSEKVNKEPRLESLAIRRQLHLALGKQVAVIPCLLRNDRDLPDRPSLREHNVAWTRLICV